MSRELQPSPSRLLAFVLGLSLAACTREPAPAGKMTPLSNWRVELHYPVPTTILLPFPTEVKDSCWITVESDGKVRFAHQPWLADSNFSHKDFSIGAKKARQIFDQCFAFEAFAKKEPSSQISLRIVQGGDDRSLRIAKSELPAVQEIFSEVDRKVRALPWTYDMIVYPEEPKTGVGREGEDS
ncbi:MAG: hypothetical protein AAF517_03815 [Planctomycetota bacterium]